MKRLPQILNNIILGSTALSVFAMASLHSQEIDKPVVDKKEAPVQIAILLDTSNSMDGLIEQAKTQLWKIVNEFNDAKQGDKIPVVQVALYEYGNNNLSAGTNFVRQILPFTRDLDKVSDELFKLTTNGGSEYCGAVIREAIDNLAWDKSPKVYKAIFIAGNEPFTQGPVSGDDTCRSAIAKGVVVNTIHCGSESDGANGGWRRGAHLAEGKFLTIDQDKAVVPVKAPQDEEITRLSIELNNTYIIYGSKGKAGKDNQMKQDGNASANASAGAPVQRALSKASANYCNDGWDLVDACKKGTVKLEAVKDADMPAEMKNLTPEERTAYIEKKSAEREKLQTQIRKLNEDRQQHVVTQQKQGGESKTLDTVIGQAVREQAATRAEITFK
ncbi:MAG: VWA domain-containing protein [Roseimicrobium sp.]